MKKKRFFAAAAALFLSVTLVTGCSSASQLVIIENDKTKRDVTEIAFYGFKADQLDFVSIENILHGFMNENSKIQVSYEGIKEPDYWDALDKRNKNNCVDDVIMIDQQHAISMNDGLADLSDIVNTGAYRSFVQNQITRQDGTVRFLPSTLSSYGLYVNYDLLRKYNLDVPESYTQFARVCNYFKQQVNVTPVICNAWNSLPALIHGKSMLDVYQDPDSRKIIRGYNENPAALAEELNEGIDFIAELITNGWIDPAETLNTMHTSTSAEDNGDLWRFSAGEQPFLITGGWAPQRLKKLLADEKKTLNFGVYPFPILADGSVLVAEINNCTAVNANSKHLTEARAFVSYLTKPDSIWEYCDGQCCLSPLKDETRVPSEKTISPTIPYYSNGRIVLGTNYQLAMPLDSYLVSVTQEMCRGMNAENAKSMLLNLLTGTKEA